MDPTSSNVYALRDGALAQLSLVGARSYEGMAQVGREIRKLGCISKKTASRLAKLDYVYKGVRHIDIYRVRAFHQQLREELAAAGGG